MNYYKLFNLKESPVVERATVSKKYIELQKKYHPDFFTQENEADKEDALATSAAINKAYNIFSNKEKTIEYFLQQKKIIVTDEKYALPPDFLMEMMELNEGFEDDNNIEIKIDNFENSLNKTVEPLLAKDNSQPFSEDNLQLLKLYYYKKKYLKRILERLED